MFAFQFSDTESVVLASLDNLCTYTVCAWTPEISWLWLPTHDDSISERLTSTLHAFCLPSIVPVSRLL